jgi:hypothetical protein
MTVAPARPPTVEALRLHRAACEAGQAGYMDPDTGLFVLTSWHLHSQGRCCGRGCRHCPWPETEQRRAGRPVERPCWPWPPPSDPS